MSPSAVTCVLADDHPPILESVSRFLAEAGYEVAATAPDGARALAAVEKHRPGVCIADVRMPRLDGLGLTREVVRRMPGTAMVLYSGFGDRGLLSDALDAGARGFALKDAPLSDLVRAIDAVAVGGVYVDPVLAAELARSGSRPGGLSNRERDVLRLLADGGTYGEIGAALFLSPDTVRAHAHHAMAKLGAKTRTEAVARALRDALIS